MKVLAILGWGTLFCLSGSAVAGTPVASPGAPSLNVTVEAVDDRIAARLGMPAAMGVLVGKVAPESMAEKAGLRANDIVFLESGQPIQDIDTFRKLTLDRKVGDTVALTVFRDGGEVELEHRFMAPDQSAQLSEMTHLAEQGDPFYQYSLGRYYEVSNDKKSVEWHRRAASSGFRRSMTRLGEYYYHGRSGKPDHREAMKWYQRAFADPQSTDEDEASALYHAGGILLAGTAVQRDIDRGLELISRAASHGNSWAWVHLGHVYTAGIDNVVESNYEKAFRCYKRADDLDNPTASFHLGMAHEEGRGVTRNYPEALKLYRQAARRAWPPAMTRIGIFYQYGFAVEKDISQASEWYQRAADLGDPVALNNLGGMYELGLGFKKDRAKAVGLYERAAANGEPKAHLNLGRLYTEGVAGTKHPDKAFKHYQAAAELGFSEGMVSLGFSYLDGTHIKKDQAQALRWFQLAAERGDAAGASALGMMYENGWAVPRDRAEAIAWYLKAADQGDQSAIARLRELQPTTKTGATK